MTGSLFLHIGPPKTATTSLQTAFEGLAHPSFVYAGVFQPRDRNRESLAEDLQKAVLNDCPEARLRLETAVRSLLGAGKHVLISEEQLVLEQSGITTEAKIARLGHILAGISTTVIVTLRSPTDALPSLYQEMYRHLPLGLQLDFARFCHDRRTDCFDYDSLAGRLALAGLGDIRWLDFERIDQGKLNTEEIFGDRNPWGKKSLFLPQLNVSAKQNGKRQLPTVTWRTLGRKPAVKQVIDRLGLRNGSLLRLAASSLERIPLRKGRAHTLIVPADRAAQLEQQYEALRRNASGTHR